MNALHEIVLEAIKIDVGQMVEEGHDLTALLAEVDRAASSGYADALLALQKRLWSRPSPPDFPYDEPSDWESISRHFPDPGSHTRFAGSDEELADRLRAAWLGRCAGCQLGKPLEGTIWPAKIKEVLQFVGSWPLEDYMNPPPDDVLPETMPNIDFFNVPRKYEWTKGRFDAVSPDDDIHYALTSQSVLEKHGADFTGEQAVYEVAVNTPYGSVFAAGRAMVRNWTFGLKPPETALFGNPCRQSLGAMIRCDPYGWAAPGNPALAARMAYKDACASQTRNGIYSGVFFAVLMADVLAHGDPVRAIDTAERYAPPKSRFAEMVRFVKGACAGERDWEKVTAAIYARYPEEAARFNHSLPNAAIVLMGLLKGGGDFTRTVGITVMAGDDTDCNGATAGSIMGCALGTGGIPPHWTEPFNDTIQTDLRGMRELRISEVARRMFEVARALKLSS